MARRTKQRYFDLDRSINPVPTQLVKKVWGLGRHHPHIDMTLTSSDLSLMDMDAPEIIPAGSTRRWETTCPDGVIAFSRTTTYQPREGAVWK